MFIGITDLNPCMFFIDAFFFSFFFFFSRLLDHTTQRVKSGTSLFPSNKAWVPHE